MYKIEFGGRYVFSNSIPEVKGSVVVVDKDTFFDKDCSGIGIITLDGMTQEEKEKIDNFLNKVKGYL